MKVAFWIGVALLFYIYLGYPLVMWLLARLVPKPVMRKPSASRFSVVISAYNEQERIGAKIASILSAENAGDIEEVIIGSDGSTDSTVAEVRRINDPRVKVVEFPQRRGKATVLNEIIPQCRSEYVVLTDARQVVDPGAFKALLADLADDRVGVVSGELVFRAVNQSMAAQGVDAYWTYEKNIRDNESRSGSVPGATGALYALRKALFRPIPTNTILDDVAIPLMIAGQGFRCVFEGEAKVYDEPSARFEQESIRKRRTIAGNAQLVMLYPRLLLPGCHPLWFRLLSHKILRLSSPLLLLGVLFLNSLLFSDPVFAWTGGMQVVAYGFVLVGWLAKKTGFRSRCLGVPYLFFVLNVTTSLALWDALTGRYEVRWVQSAKG